MKSDTSKLDVLNYNTKNPWGQRIDRFLCMGQFWQCIFKMKNLGASSGFGPSPSNHSEGMTAFLLADDINHGKRFFMQNLILSAVINKVRSQCKGVNLRLLFKAAILKQPRMCITMIRIVIVDGQDSDRNDTEQLLSAQGDFKVVGTGKDGYEAIRLADCHKPDMLLLDINLSYLDGIKISSILNSRYPLMAMIIFTRLEDERHIRNALTNGVSGYLFKNKDMEKLADLIRVLHSSGCLIFPRIAAGFVREGEPCLKADQQFPVNLSRMELQIIRHIGKGLKNQEIAEKMRLKKGTIRNHISVILQKTALRNRTQLAIFAVQNGLAKEASVS
jgi:DNA-binding NarL/FixJ family response regulator